MPLTPDQRARREELLAWCARLLETMRSTGSEVDYKERIAERVAQARTALEAGEPWLDPLARGLRGRYHLLGWRDAAAFLDWARDRPEVAARITGRLWADGDAEAFLDDLPRDAVSAPGARASVMSALLLGRDPAAPPYRAAVQQGALALLRRERHLPDDLPGDIGRWRAWVDLVEELGPRLADARPIDVQGTLWWAVKRRAPDGWPPDEQEAFDRFRGRLGNQI